ncbi:hypothetical protein NDU88_000696 [Pleurodeles waltl]|uniref:Uncharacterized protein n=1 Tax=Pleurodeles waltl TaxID=8319 RepID=A0AAV7LAZ4_PLEWA|nr:hypothetical protein NDU88_000696 [Pleurodeles waltl]
MLCQTNRPTYSPCHPGDSTAGKSACAVPARAASSLVPAEVPFPLHEANLPDLCAARRVPEVALTPAGSGLLS